MYEEIAFVVAIIKLAFVIINKFVRTKLHI